MAEMTEQEELQIFQLITAAGSAKSTFMEALYKAKEGKYDEAEKLFKEARRLLCRRAPCPHGHD